MRKFTLLISFCCAYFVQAQNIFREDMGTYTTNVSLSGQGGWTNSEDTYGLGSCTATSCTNSTVVQQTVGYLNWGTANRSVVLTPNGDGCGMPFTSQSTGYVYLGFVLRLTDCSSTNYEFMRLCGGNLQTVAMKIYVKKLSSTQYNVGISKNAGNIVWSSTNYNFNTNQLIVLKYGFMSGASDDLLLMYTNPNINNTEPSLPNAITNIGDDATSHFDHLIINQLSPNAPSGRIGLISMARSWTTLKFSALENESFTANQFIINQNPIDHTITIQNGAESDTYSLEFYNSIGQRVYTTSVELSNGSVTPIDVNTSLATGMYLVQIINKEKKKVIKKLMVN
ncbi:T9SS type A sorting domain-containing protein [Flavobacterium sp. N1719]|uniref:T9SS type A sorting domain-containing protein n=1 Tax=Flavobacterium sp. N1719 TaxID=2885633 RepID=UPI002222D9DD|nr:T9SS type A sorting domain-containing protein [Flavobacterium sp. N1719]